jgi:hypothetical protein
LEKTKKGVKEVKLEMNRNLKIATVLIILVVVGIGSYLWAIANFPTPQFEPRRLPFDGFSRDMDWFRSSVADIELYYTLKTVISSINATLLVILLVTYLDIYKTLKSEFTLGLIIFSMILLLYALVSNPLMQRIFGFQAIGLGPFAMLPDLFTGLALAVLLYLTMK